jgi:hypothetical protein
MVGKTCKVNSSVALSVKFSKLGLDVLEYVSLLIGYAYPTYAFVKTQQLLYELLGVQD